MNCNWCKHQIDKICSNYKCVSFSKYEPKTAEETKMEKPIFESEEHYIKFMNDIIPDSIVSKWSIIKSSGEDAKEKGYIKKPSLEIARENVNNLKNKFNEYHYYGGNQNGKFYTENDQWQQHACNLIQNMSEFIHELEKEIIRLSELSDKQ